MLVKDASKKDISESKRRLEERQKQRRLDRDAKQAVDIVNRHRDKIKKSKNEKE